MTRSQSAAPDDATARGQSHFDLSVQILRPPSEVFALLADIQDAEPIPRRARVRMVKDPDGPTVLGTRWHEQVKVAPLCWLRIESVVSELHSPNLLGMDFRSRWFSGHLTYQIAAAGRGSILRQRESLRPRAGLTWSSRWIARRLRPRLEQRLEDIKHLLETAN